MPGLLLPGRRTWSLVRDEDGYREYKVKWLVKVDNLEGPNTALNTPGLPLPGSVWAIDNDSDTAAYCKPNANVNPVNEDGTNDLFSIEQTFSTKPPENQRKACKDQQIDDPLLEPQKVSGTFEKKQKEAAADRYGDRILTSSFEPIKGKSIEFDVADPTVKIEQNVANLQYDLLCQLINNLNDAPLWGFDPRCVMLSAVSWEKVYYGQCYYYYKRTLEFSINEDSFDREVLDEGTKALNGRWGRPERGESENWILIPINGAPPNPNNPAHYTRFRDRSNELSRVILSQGRPYDPGDTGTGSFRVHEPGGIWVEFYRESNLLLLGIPTVL